MWRRTAYIIAFGAILAVCRKSSGQETGQPELLITHLNWVRFEISMGRILATAHRTKQDRQRAHRDLPSGASETLAVTIDRGFISLQYSMLNDQERLRVVVVRRDQLQIEWIRQDENDLPTTTVYVQGVDDDVSLTIRSPHMPEQVYRSTSLWHLMLTHPGVCQQHLVTVLDALRPNWNTQKEAAEIRSALCDPKRIQQSVSRREVQLMVEQLTEKRFRVRRQADRQLRAWGRSALCFLNELDPDRLDAEQRLRIKSIQAAIQSDTVDSPARVAAWLVNDMTVWLALLSDDDLRHRRIARDCVTRLANHPVDFDPDASPTVRANQVAVMRAALLSR